MSLSKKERDMIEAVGESFAKQMKGSLDAIGETLKRLEPLVQKHELILGETEVLGLRGKMAGQEECLRGLQNFETEIKAKAGLVATFMSTLVLALGWLVEHFLTKK
jgi:hypothetical protein